MKHIQNYEILYSQIKNYCVHKFVIIKKLFTFILCLPWAYQINITLTLLKVKKKNNKHFFSLFNCVFNFVIKKTVHTFYNHAQFLQNYCLCLMFYHCKVKNYCRNVY